jgi:toxin YoeB
MKVVFHEPAWEQYCYWQTTDKKILRKINELIRDISRDPYDGLGKPKPLKRNLRGYWSRRINDEHRIVYQIMEESVVIIGCRSHYEF